MTELIDLIRPGTGRGLDFVNLDELRKRTGIIPKEILKFAMSEMLCNSLDTDATEVWVNIEFRDGFHWLTVRDNGSKRIIIKDLKLILDFSNKASSKRGFLRVSRGYLGNALKCIFGYSHALAKANGIQPPEIIVSSHGHEYRIKLMPDKIKDYIKPEIQTTKIDNDGRNAFEVAFLTSISNITVETLRSLLAATSMVNPGRRISFDLWSQKGAMGEAIGGEDLRKETSILWYTPDNFRDLFNDYVRASPKTQLKELIPLFRGFSRKPIIRNILHDLNKVANHDCPNSIHMQFVPTTPISDLTDRDIGYLYFVMKNLGKKINKRSLPQVLGVVSEDQFKVTMKQNGWERLRYTCIVESEDQITRIYPYIIELAIFDRDKNDTEGLKVYQCVNFMASTEDIFSKMFNISHRLGSVGISQKTPVTVVVHLVSPVLSWLNYGKSGLYE